MKSMRNISCVLEYLVPYLNPMNGDHVCILGDFNATPGSPRFNEICDMLHENKVGVLLPEITFKLYIEC